MYKSPIEVKLSDHFSALKTVEFDKEQYEQGWNDRDSQIVRCKDCKWWNSSKGWCSDNGSYWRSSDFCSDAERRVKE